MMSDQDRRTFLKDSAVGAAAVTVAGIAPHVHAAGGQKKDITFALIGCGGRGTHVGRLFVQNKGVRIKYVCDPDERRLKQATGAFGGQEPKPLADMRDVLADDSLDAVLVATPDHWHAPAAILACDAGKHVYVEKPCSHNVREGRLLVEAARRNKRVVQHGTQVRSTSMMIEAVQKLRDGVIGDVLAAKAWNIQRRRSIGHGKPSDPPGGFDYDLWCGPAPKIPYQDNRVQGGWHWWHHFGTGDMGNDGVHDIDYCRWGLGVETHPSAIAALGGKYFFDDDQEFPDTQQVTFEYDGDGKPGSKRMLIYEQRLWSTSYPYNVDSGVEFYGTAGRLFLSRRGKAQLVNAKNQRVDLKIELQAQDEISHVADFLDAVRTGRKPNADIELGHITSSLCHLGNVATRLGRTLRFDPAKEQFVGDEEANRLVSREYRDHWGRPKGA